MSPQTTPSHAPAPQPVPRPHPAAHDTAGAIRPFNRAAVGVEYWRIQRVAQYLDVTPKRVYQLIQERKLVAIQLSPRSTRVLRQSIEDYLATLLEQASPS